MFKFWKPLSKMNLNRILSKLDASQNHWSNFWWRCLSYERNFKLIFSMYRLFIKINWVVYKYIRLWVSISRRIRSVEGSSGKSASVKKFWPISVTKLHILQINYGDIKNEWVICTENFWWALNRAPCKFIFKSI